MNSTVVTEIVDKQEWLNPVGETLQNAVGSTYKAGGSFGKTVADFLHGVWLGHPLHPVLTDIPVGAWTVAAAADIMELRGQEELGPGADAAIAVGLVGALGAAASGLTDWYLLEEKEARKTGTAHALLNTAATLLYGTSWFLRKTPSRRPLARTLSWVGYALVGASAYLGGSLVYEQKLGVDHATDESAPQDFKSVMADEDLAENMPKRAELDGSKILLVRQNGVIYALAESCSHLGGPLSEGKLEDGTIQCPWHASRFALADGKVIDGPATFPQPCFETRVRAGQIEVRSKHKN